MPWIIGISIGLFVAILLFVYPWLSIAMLLAVPIVKLGAMAYIPIFRTVDLTVLCSALAGLSAIWTFARGATYNTKLAIPWRMLACLGLVAVLMGVGLLWTTAPDYGMRKVTRFAGLALPHLLLPMFFVRKKEDGARMLGMMILVSVFVALALIIAPHSELSAMRYGRGYARGTFLGSDANMPAAVIAVGMLVLLTAFVVGGGSSRWLRYSALIVFPVGLLAMLITGSRANLIGLMATIMLMPFLSGKRDIGKSMFISIVFIPSLLALAFLTASLAGIIPLSRWLNFLSGLQAGELTGSRTLHWTFCLTEGWGSPLVGHGPGSFAVDLFRVDTPMWPHNIVLEAFYETGLAGVFGIVMFFVVCFTTARRGLRAARDPRDRLLVVAPTVMVFFMMVPALTHWDLEGIRFLYLFAGLLHANVVLVKMSAADVLVPLVHGDHQAVLSTPIPQYKTFDWIKYERNTLDLQRR